MNIKQCRKRKYVFTMQDFSTNKYMYRLSPHVWPTESARWRVYLQIALWPLTSACICIFCCVKVVSGCQWLFGLDSKNLATRWYCCLCFSTLLSVSWMYKGLQICFTQGGAKPHTHTYTHAHTQQCGDNEQDEVSVEWRVCAWGYIQTTFSL